MGYHDDIHEKIVSEGMDKTPEYVKKKIDDYQQIANINYRLYKNAKTKKDAQSSYVASQNAYAKLEAWKEVLSILLRKLSSR